MAFPWTLSASGIITPSALNVENVLATDNNNGTYSFQVDWSALTGGVAVFRVYAACLLGGNLVLAWEDWIGPGAPSSLGALSVSPFIASDINLKVTLMQTAGILQPYNWKLLRQ